MTISPRRPVPVGVRMLSIVPLLLAGCHRPAAQLELVFYDDPYFPETSRLVFDDCTYCLDASRDLHIACGQREPAAAGQTPSRRLLHIRVFWPVHPGVTFSDRSGTNATVRLLVEGPQGSALYTGTGFVYYPKPGAKRLSAALESGRIRLQTWREKSDQPRDARISGALRPRLDEHVTVDLVRELDLAPGGH